VASIAYEKATVHARRGLELVQGLQGEQSLRARRKLSLLLVLGSAAITTNGLPAINIFRDAAEIARAEGLSAELTKAALGFERAERGLNVPSEASVALLEEAMTMVGPEETMNRCRLLSCLGRALQSIGAAERASEVTRKAMPLARRLNDQPSILDCLMCEILSSNTSPITAQQFDHRRMKLQEANRIAQSYTRACRAS
jgi:hypothetical protein